MPHTKTPLSFDEFASDYRHLLRDPIRDRFANGSNFFYTRKLLLLRRFFEARGIHTKSMSWLDVGCGRGDFLKTGLDDFDAVAGCDPSQEMLRACPELPTRLQAHATEVPFPDKTFDLATLVCVLHHVAPADRMALVADVARIVNPGGWLCIIEHNPFNPVTRLIVSRSPVDVDAQLLSARQSRRLLIANGNAIVSTSHFLYLPESVFHPLRFLEDALSRVPLGGQYAVFGRKPD